MRQPRANGWSMRWAREAAVAKHFVALSTNTEAVRKFGIDTADMFGFWDWVGGRYSMDSAIGLSTMIAIGPEGFRDMLAGFRAMDEHFRTAPPETQPAAAAGPADRLVQQLLRRADARRDALLVAPATLSRLPAAIADGEQRQACRSARPCVNVQTGPIIWGEPGTDGQHSFYQLLHQGTKLVPCDFIGFCRPLSPARRSAQSADGEPVCASRGAGLRQDRGGTGRRRFARVPDAIPSDRGQSPEQCDPRGRPDPM